MNIPQPKKHFMTRFGIPLSIIVITAGVLIFASWNFIRSSTKVEVVTVVMRTVQTNEPQVNTDKQSLVIQAPGWVEAEPYAIYAGALTEGIVKEVLILEGDKVKKGQIIAKLVDEDKKLALKTALANEELWEGKVLAAKAKIEEITDEYTRKELLVDSGSLAKGPVERLRLRLLTEEANVAIAKASLKDANITKEIAQLAYDRCTVVSPIDGVVIELIAWPGSVIAFNGADHSSHIAHMYEPTNLQIRADVPLADASQVGVGHPAKIIVDVLPNTIFEGEIVRFVHRADQQKNTVEAKIKILEPSDLLKPDMLARVKILQPKLDENKEGTWSQQRAFIPMDAIENLNKPSVLIVSKLDKGLGTAERRTLLLGDNEFDGWIEVLSGVSTGDKIITSSSLLKDGDIVRIEGKN